MTKYKNVEEKIDEALELSKKREIEYGFNICLVEGEVATTKLEEGFRAGIRIVNKCPGRSLGSFHTHPSSRDAIPSQGDIQNARYGFFCIGVNAKDANGDGKIVKCYDKRDFPGN